MAKQNTSTSILRAYGAGLLHLFYPRLCEGCGKPLLKAEDVLCIGCEALLARTSYHHLAENETSLRLSGRFSFVNASSFAYFSSDGLIQHLVHGLKYREKKNAGRYLGNIFGFELKLAGWRADVIIPIPLHPTKEVLRGYNQSVLIAEGISTVLQIPVLKNAVIRARQTESQTDKSRADRVQNVRDAFKVVLPGMLNGKHVLLVDDVITTGATIEACAAAISASCNNIRISVATIAIAMN